MQIQICTDLSFPGLREDVAAVILVEAVDHDAGEARRPLDFLGRTLTEVLEAGGILYRCQHRLDQPQRSAGQRGSGLHGLHLDDHARFAGMDGCVEPLSDRGYLEAEKVLRPGAVAGARQDVPDDLDRVGTDQGSELDAQQVLRRQSQQDVGRSRRLKDDQAFRVKDYQDAVRLDRSGNFDRFAIAIGQIRHAERWVRYDHTTTPGKFL